MAAKPPTPTPRRVLIVSLRFLGDALLSTPLAAAAKRQWPSCEVDMLVFRGCESMLEGNPDVDRVIAVDQRPGKWAQWRQLRASWNRYDLAFITQAGTRPFLYGWTAARRAVAPVSAERGKSWWKQALLWKHVPIAGPRFLENEALLKAAGMDGAPAPTPPSAGLDTAALSARVGADLSRPYVVLHPSPRWRYKRWTDDGWRALIAHLLDKGFVVMVTGGPGDDERGYLAQVLGDLKSPSLIPLPGRLSIGETADLIRAARLFVGVDTATTHVASATGTPTVAIFGPTDPAIWGPWPRGDGFPYQRVASGQRRGNVLLLQNAELPCVPCQLEGCERHVDSRSDCLDRLAPARVIEEVDRVLAEGNAFRR